MRVVGPAGAPARARKPRPLLQNAGGGLVAAGLRQVSGARPQAERPPPRPSPTNCVGEGDKRNAAVALLKFSTTPRGTSGEGDGGRGRPRVHGPHRPGPTPQFNLPQAFSAFWGEVARNRGGGAPPESRRLDAKSSPSPGAACRRRRAAGGERERGGPPRARPFLHPGYFQPRASISRRRRGRSRRAPGRSWGWSARSAAAGPRRAG